MPKLALPVTFCANVGTPSFVFSGPFNPIVFAAGDLAAVALDAIWGPCCGLVPGYEATGAGWAGFLSEPAGGNIMACC